MTRIDSILWKIGSSVVMTVPSIVVREMGINGREKKILAVMVEKPYGFSFLAKPWKCGGSFVVTVPSSCVEVYDLRKEMEAKTKMHANMVLANGKVGLG